VCVCVVLSRTTGPGDGGGDTSFETLIGTLIPVPPVFWIWWVCAYRGATRSSVQNLARDPRWGRIEETPGECPFVNGEYAFAFTKGFQEGYDSTNGSSAYLKASVTVKHYAA
jgi:hypothetical protein